MILNTPGWAYALWQMVRPLLPTRTSSKVWIMSLSYHSKSVSDPHAHVKYLLEKLEFWNLFVYLSGGAVLDVDVAHRHSGVRATRRLPGLLE